MIRKSNVWIAVAVVSSVWWHRTASTDFGKNPSVYQMAQARLANGPASKSQAKRRSNASAIARNLKKPNEQKKSSLLVKNWIEIPSSR